MDEFAQQLTAIYINHPNINNKPQTIVLLRYICDEDLWTYQSEFAPLPVVTHNILLDRIKGKLTTHGINMITVYMLPDQYELWRNENNVDNDDAAARAAWMAVQVTDDDEKGPIEGDITIAVY
jgi:hypothetical protein